MQTTEERLQASKEYDKLFLKLDKFWKKHVRYFPTKEIQPCGRIKSYLKCSMQHLYTQSSKKHLLNRWENLHRQLEEINRVTARRDDPCSGINCEYYTYSDSATEECKLALKARRCPLINKVMKE